MTARLRWLSTVQPIDVAAAVERGLALQNGIYGVLDHYQETAHYYFFGFRYTIESDETSLGAVIVGLNRTARSLAPQPEFLLNAIRDDLEEDPQPGIPGDHLAEFSRIALRAVQPEIRRLATGIEQSANRRLARDTERIESYYKTCWPGSVTNRAASRRPGSGRKGAQPRLNRIAPRSWKIFSVSPEDPNRTRRRPGSVVSGAGDFGAPDPQEGRARGKAPLES